MFPGEQLPPRSPLIRRPRYAAGGTAFAFTACLAIQIDPSPFAYKRRREPRAGPAAHRMGSAVPAPAPACAEPARSSPQSPRSAPLKASLSARRRFSFREPAEKNSRGSLCTTPRDVPARVRSLCCRARAGAQPARRSGEPGRTATSCGEQEEAARGARSPGPPGGPAPEARARPVLAARPRLLRKRAPPSPPNSLLLFSLSV